MDETGAVLTYLRLMAMTKCGNELFNMTESELVFASVAGRG